MPGAFLDSNVLVYAFTADARAERAKTLVADGGTISVQVLNEFANVARRKLGMDWRELREAVATIRVLCPVILPVDVDIHDEALRLAERYRIGIYDGAVIAAALKARCDTLWSEDLQHGLVIDRQTRIVDPFRPA